ncbi:hypothetical protein LOS15_06280 [Halomonas sp. 7T]|uniref:hypothetical protein n=1 Tax=Halomonas sp. 7T TaxID=2893469 RepID=UPI0021D9DE32|nr:hypothetical protein [Halomonas sp. 7T]UXZ55630.1 hypothetical protein LOS15_06280 [Halomonas sp. 7T]
MKIWGKQAERIELNVLVSDIAAGTESFNSIAYALAKIEAKSGFMFEMTPPDERYDSERGNKAGEIAAQEDLPAGLGALAGLICLFESTGQNFELAKQSFGTDVYDFLRQASPGSDIYTGNDSTDFAIKVSHYAKASPLAQTAIMLDLLAMVEIDRPHRLFMEWWDQPVMAMQAGDLRIRKRLIRAMS